MEKRITPTKPTKQTPSGLYIDQFPPNPESPKSSETPKDTKDPASSRIQATPTSPLESPTSPLVTPQHRWIRPVRLLLWLIVIIALSIGFSLRAHSQSSAAFSNGTSSVLSFWAKVFLWPATILALLNLIWGVTRWILRWRREHWRPGQVIGKLIGGGIWRFCAVAPLVLLSLFLIAPPIYRTISTSVLNRTLVGSDVLLASAYSTGAIDADTYLTYLLNASYNTSALPAAYHGSDPLVTPDFLTFIDQHFDELSPDLILSVLETISLANLDFDTDASGNISSSFSPFSQNAYATTKVTTLNKAHLSSGQHFVIFYTDTGDDAISDQDAATVASMLESIISNYSSVLGFDYEYKLYSVSGSKAKKMGKILEANGIDKNITDTAMAVYIANPYGGPSNTLATYAGRRFTETESKIVMKLASVFTDGNEADFYVSTPAFPFINILPSNLSSSSLEIVTAHELGHHYASNYCYSATGNMCSDNDFIDEAAPDFFAANVVTSHPADNLVRSNHHAHYIRQDFRSTIDQAVQGYPAAAFLQNYYETVPDAMDKILHALTTDTALQYLYNAAGITNFRQVMTSLTERNLTNSYGTIASFRADELPSGEEIPCADLCTASYSIAPASSRYLYFPSQEYQNVTLSISAPDQVTISLLGRKRNSWTVLSSGQNTAEFTIPEDAEYDTYAFALANYSITSSGNFSLEVTAAPLEDLVADSPLEFDPNGLPIILLSDSCLGFNFDSIIDFPLQVYRILSQFDPDHDYSDLFAQLEAENAELKSSLTYHYATLCITELKPDLDFATTRASLRRSIGPNLEFFSINDPDLRLSMLTTYDLFRLEGRFYFLMQIGTDTALITARMFEKIPEF